MSRVYEWISEDGYGDDQSYEVLRTVKCDQCLVAEHQGNGIGPFPPPGWSFYGNHRQDYLSSNVQPVYDFCPSCAAVLHDMVLEQMPLLRVPEVHSYEMVMDDTDVYETDLKHTFGAVAPDHHVREDHRVTINGNLQRTIDPHCFYCQESWQGEWSDPLVPCPSRQAMLDAAEAVNEEIDAAEDRAENWAAPRIKTPPLD